MLIQVSLLLLATLWLLLCLRFYRFIAAENIWQRRLIAIAGGATAGLIYVLGTWLSAWVRMPAPVQQSEQIRIQTR